MWQGADGKAALGEFGELKERDLSFAPFPREAWAHIALTFHLAAFPQAAAPGVNLFERPAGTRLGPRFRVSLHVGKGRAGLMS